MQPSNSRARVSDGNNQLALTVTAKPKPDRERDEGEVLGNKKPKGHGFGTAQVSAITDGYKKMRAGPSNGALALALPTTGIDPTPVQATRHTDRGGAISKEVASCISVLRYSVIFGIFIFQTKTYMHQPTPPLIPGRVVVEIRSKKITEYRSTENWWHHTPHRPRWRHIERGGVTYFFTPVLRDFWYFYFSNKNIYASTYATTHPRPRGDNKHQKSWSTGVQKIGGATRHTDRGGAISKEVTPRISVLRYSVIFGIFIFQTKTYLHQPTPPPIPGRVEIRSTKITEYRSIENGGVVGRRTTPERRAHSPLRGGRTPPPSRQM